MLVFRFGDEGAGGRGRPENDRRCCLRRVRRLRPLRPSSSPRM